MDSVTQTATYRRAISVNTKNVMKYNLNSKCCYLTVWTNSKCFDVANTCFNIHLDECVYDNYVYTGEKSVDLYGNQCWKWVNESLHVQGTNPYENNIEVRYTFEYIGDHNYCRNSLVSSLPSCFTNIGLSPCFNACSVTTTPVAATVVATGIETLFVECLNCKFC